MSDQALSEEELILFAVSMLLAGKDWSQYGWSTLTKRHPVRSLKELRELPPEELGCAVRAVAAELARFKRRDAKPKKGTR